jgi:hypothetical protein
MRAVEQTRLRCTSNDEVGSSTYRHECLKVGMQAWRGPEKHPRAGHLLSSTAFQVARVSCLVSVLVRSQVVGGFVGISAA